jgi:hypothetical protein
MRDIEPIRISINDDIDGTNEDVIKNKHEL